LPKYFLPSGKVVHTENAIPENQLDDFLGSFGDQGKSTDSPSADTSNIPEPKLAASHDSTPKKKGYLDIAGDFLNAHPVLHRLVLGPTDDDMKYYKETAERYAGHPLDDKAGQILGPGFAKIPGLESATDKLANYVTGSDGNLRLAAGALIKGVGGFLETAADPRGLALRGNHPDITTSNVRPDITASAPTPKPKLGLPSAPQDIIDLRRDELNPARFISGEKGVADATKTYKLDTGGGRYPLDAGEVVDIPARLAASHGLNMGEVPKIDISSAERANDSMQRLVNGQPMEMLQRPNKTVKMDNARPKPTIGAFPADKLREANIGSSIPYDASGRPTVPLQPNVREPFRTPEDLNITDSVGPSKAKPIASEVGSGGVGKGTIPKNDIAADNASGQFNLKDAIADWAYRQQGARVRGNILKSKLESSGNTGAEVESAVTEHRKAFEQQATKNLFQKLVDQGLVQAPKNPNSIPKDVSYFKFADPSSPEAKFFRELTDNVKGNLYGDGSPEGLNKVANAFSTTKNFALGSGIPYTPLNMHMYNITRSNIMARGLKNGLGDFFSGVFHPAGDLEAIAKHTDSGLLADLVDHGMGWSEIEGHAAPMGEAANNKISGAIDKAVGMQQKVFEDPLFKIHLPKVKLDFASERVSELLKRGVDKESALTQAAKEANDFYGGINKVLRNKTYSDLARIGALAPDWLESRLNLAYKGALSAVGKADPIYGKALARGMGMRAAGMGATAGLTGYALNQSKRATNSADVPLGKTSTGLNRDLPIYGSSAEGLRIPEEVMNGRDLGEVVSSRMSQPFRATSNIIQNRDSFGNPLRGQDKYGRPISTSRGMMNTAKEAASVIQPPWLVAIEKVLSGEDPEAAIATGLELPLKYNREPKDKNALRIR
jgi:hypothetical protein